MTEVASPTSTLPRLVLNEQVELEIKLAAGFYNERARLEAEREIALEKVREQYEELIAPVSIAYETCEARCMSWASRNRKTHFAATKVFETQYGSIILRKGQPKLVIIGKAKVADIVKKLKELKLSDFVRTKETIDRQALLKKRDGVVVSECGEFNLDDLGLRVSQPERFKLSIVQEPKTAMPATETAGAK